MRIIILCLTVLLLPAYVHGAQPQQSAKPVGGAITGSIDNPHKSAAPEQWPRGKPPWQWTEDERIAMRVAAFEPGRRIHTTAAHDSGFTIDGRQRPELIMPSQLFGALLTSLEHAGEDLDYRNRLRARYADTIQRLGWKPDAFWAAITLHAHSYNVLTSSNAPRSEQSSITICRTRIIAMRDMRAHFAGFDEFLYRSIAPDFTLTGFTADSAEQLRWLEAGCQ